MPPIVVEIGKIQSLPDAGLRSTEISVPITVRNAQGEDLTIGVFLSNGRTPVASADPSLRARDGRLMVKRTMKNVRGNNSVDLRMPVASKAILGKGRKLRVSALVMADDQVVVTSKEYDAVFPK